MLLVMQHCIRAYQPSASFLVPEQVYRSKAVGDIVVRKQFDVAFQQIRCTDGSCTVYTVMFGIGTIIISLHKPQTGNLSVTRRCDIERACYDFVQVATCGFLLCVANRVLYLREERTMCIRFRSFPS